MKGNNISKTSNHLIFEDWISSKEHERKDWIIVARFWKNDKEDFYTFSVCVKNCEELTTKILSNHTWDVSQDFGNPFFDSDGNYEPMYSMEENGLIFTPFVIFRTYHDIKPAEFDLIQNFILYHQAYYSIEDSTYYRIGESANAIPIVKIKKENNNFQMEVDSNELKDYLAATQSHLIRFHDHRRYFKINLENKDIKKLFNKETQKKGDNFNYSIFVSPFNFAIKEKNVFSRLKGKDIIKPFKNPANHHIWWLFDKNQKSFVTFIIDIDENGNQIEEICNEDGLSSYFSKKENVHFLTPVFFKKKVLSKYYNAPSRFTVTSNLVSCLNLWNIPIDLTKENLIQVYLGDLGRIPYEEQLHWRRYNVIPKGDITDHRFKRDFEARFADPKEDFISDLWKLFDELQESFKSVFNEYLFRELNEDDQKIVKTIHIPLTNEWKEFDELVLFLAKLTNDSVNVEFLKKVTGKSIDEVKIKGSIDLLFKFLEDFKVDVEKISIIVKPFKMLQQIRSSGSAHRRGRNFSRVLRKYNLLNLSNQNKFKKIVKDLNNSLEMLVDIIKKEQKNVKK